MKKIKLTQNKYALVDNDDYERVSQYKWHAAKNWSTFYAHSWIYDKNKKKKRNVMMHRFIMNIYEADKNLFVDHVNCNGLDNRKENLRTCTVSENVIRAKPRNALGLKGVSMVRRKRKNGFYIRYNAKIMHKRKVYYLGWHDTKEQAALAYNKKAKELFGEFAYLNKIKETK